MIKKYTLALGLFVSVVAYAETIATQAPASSIFSFGGDVRFRNEYFNNDLTLNDTTAGHEQDYFRTRTRFWVSYVPVSAFTFNARLAAEPRTWMLQPTFAKQHPGLGTEWRYAIVDLLNAKWTLAPEGPWAITCTAGRQDIQLGEAGSWWLVADGTPGDGSWTTFFDALRISIENKKTKAKLDFVALSQRAVPDSNLGIIGARNTYSLTEQNEKGLMLYASIPVAPETRLDSYAFYKRDRKAFSTGDTANIYTVGSRVYGTQGEHWSYSTEAAVQGGSKTDGAIKWSGTVGKERDIRAWGTNARLTYLLKDTWSNKFNLNFEYLSGDDPKTQDKDEMFDILWGRYPRWSDAYAFAYAPETGGKIAQLNNLIRLGPSWSMSPSKTLNISAAYSILLAPEAVPTRATNSSLFSFNGHKRGDYCQLVVRQQFNKNLSGLVCLEILTQGNFYVNRDMQSFLRMEIATQF